MNAGNKVSAFVLSVARRKANKEDAEMKSGRTPLLVAARCGRLEICKWLIENGSEWQDVVGKMYEEKKVDVMVHLLKLGAIFNRNPTSSVEFNRILEVSSLLMLRRPVIESNRETALGLLNTDVSNIVLKTYGKYF